MIVACDALNPVLRDTFDPPFEIGCVSADRAILPQSSRMLESAGSTMNLRRGDGSHTCFP
ncbi:hypothetical protein [Burkholderia sp. PU8-34]